MLTGARKTQRMVSALTFLEQYHKDGHEFLSHRTSNRWWNLGLICECWITKEQSKQWMHTHSPNKPKKFKQTSARKLMAPVFWERKGVHAPRDQNNVRSVLRKTKKRLCSAIQNRRCGMLTYGEVLLHDNDHPHTAVRTRALLEHFHWELFSHHYSPDLAPSDCHLFTYPKKWLWSQHFNNNEELMDGVKTWQSSQAVDFFHTDMFQMISFCLHHCCIWTVKQILITQTCFKLYNFVCTTVASGQLSRFWSYRHVSNYIILSAPLLHLDS
jgi:histone-lysine N-methyltransferase SETMAR